MSRLPPIHSRSAFAANTRKDPLSKAPRIAIVGCGAIAELYYLPAISKSPSVLKNLVLVDTNEARLKELASKFNIRNYKNDYREILNEVAGVIVAVPPCLHYRISMDFLEKGVHVLCEKPLTESSFEAKEMVAQARKSGVTISVNNTRRLFHSYSKTKELISDGTIGNIISIKFIDGETFQWPTVSGFYFNRTSKKGVLLDRGCHGLDTICWWLGGKPKVISCENDSFGGVEGVTLAKFEYKGCLVEVKLSWLTQLQNTYTIVGELGMIEGGIEEWNSVTISYKSGKKEKIKVKSKERHYNDFGDKIVANFLDVVSKGATPLIPANEIIPSIELLEECYRSAKSLRMPWHEILKRSVVDKKTILVTGATGFIGGRLVEALYLSGWANVRAGIRQWSKAARIARFPVEIALCDIMDPEQIARAVTGADSIVHCAVGDRQVTIQGTKNVLEAALQRGVQQFVHLSTAEVYGNVSAKIDETFPYQYTGNEYADSKIEAEKLCWRFCEKGVSATVLRPSIVYGPFSETWTIEIAERLQSGHWGVFKSYGEGICNLVYIDDLVSAILSAIEHRNVVGEAFNINGPERITWNRYFQCFNDTLGLPMLRAISPARSKMKTAVRDRIISFTSYFLDRFGDTIMDIYMRGGVLRKIMKQVKNSLDTTPSSTELQNLYSRDAFFVTSKAQRMLGYKPKFDLAAGLRMSVLWLDHHGFLHQPPSLPGNASASVGEQTLTADYRS
ncbi:MAG: NAD-dependent epimerase/dehydratase family protein [Candidatus Hodarchaeota archaeon]